MIKKYRFCFFCMFVFGLLSVYNPTGFGSLLSIILSLIAFLIGGAHIHEMYSKPLVRKGLRLASCTKRSQTLGRVRMRGVFM